MYLLEKRIFLIFGLFWKELAREFYGVMYVVYDSDLFFF